jgi:hypothetical protein
MDNRTSIEKKIFNKKGEWTYKKFEEDITVGDMYLLGDPNGSQTAVMECVKVPYKKDKNLYYEKKYRLLFPDFEEKDVNDVENQTAYRVATHETKGGDVSRNYEFRVVLSSITDLPVGCSLILRFYNHYLVVLVKYKKKLNPLSGRIWDYRYMRFSFDHVSGIKNNFVSVKGGYREQYAKAVGIKYIPDAQHVFIASDFTKNYLKKL